MATICPHLFGCTANFAQYLNQLFVRQLRLVSHLESAVVNCLWRAMEELRNIVEGISKLRDIAYAHYSLLVEQVLKDQITDEQQLEQIMDGLCDFCDEIRFIDLYRSLCRHIYYQYPQLVGEHVALFRALFEGPDEK